MRIYLLILISLFIGACTKPVDTVYYKKEDLTRFKTKSFKAEKKNKEIELVAIKECPGKVICTDREIKLSVIHAGRFTFLKGKDLDLETEQGQIDLNQRDYSYSYNNKKKSKVGTSGVLTEQFLIWVSEPDFIKAARAEKATMYIGDYTFELSSEGRDAWQIMMDKERLLKIMDEEQQREYGQYPHENKERKELDLREKRMVSEAAESTWKMIDNSDNPEDFRYFLEQFPDSPYVIPAKLKLKQLERESL
ncbi:hypothetical protein OAK48_00365 [Deltaproteobacteria bacterium]|nr:hypothetical protein [Deltaproteobacteria bacterium]